MSAVSQRHPKALPYLFLTELWERFGFYIVQGILVLYMSRFFHFSDNQSYSIAGLFSGLVYISPFLGGYIADNYFGFRNTILWGGFFLSLGYGLLAITGQISLFYLALAIIIVGNGLFKPNVSSLLGSQYNDDDPRRDSGFTIFYVGINIGSALSGLSGYFKNAYGWNMPFALACVGILIGLTTFYTSLNKIKFIQQPQANTKTSIIFLLCVSAIVFILQFLFQNNSITNLLMPIVGISLLFYMGIIWMRQTTQDRKRLLILFLLILSSILFWALFLQLFTSANLYVERLVDKHLFGIKLSTTVFYASEGLFIVIMGPLFALIWQWLGEQRNPSAVSKFFIGLLLTASAFFLLSMSTYSSVNNGLISPLWVFGAYFLITLGELFLSPTGLSAVTLLAPRAIISTMMGLWFVATGYGGLASGALAKLASVPNETASFAEKLQIYHSAFQTYAYVAFTLAMVLMVANFMLQKIYLREENSAAQKIRAEAI